ncbi:MAG: FAD-dependent oxidoreductase, partial [Oscillospiraceae bacterium]|nr:FAD-dependent oxidoreductase [Oscillospiraceae bacterium]
VHTKNCEYICDKLIIAAGRSGSRWFSEIAAKFGIETRSNKVDIGVRLELPAIVFEHLTRDTHEVKICYRTRAHGDAVRTFCMNPNGIVVSENTNGIVTVNGHSYREKDKLTDNTNFALLVSNTFSEPFNDSNAYGESVARLSNMLSGGILVQRYGDLIKGRRTTAHRLSQSFVKPTLDAAPGDLSLVIPKRQLDDIIEMIEALENIAPGTANTDTLLYGVEVKFYNSTVKVDNNFETKCKGMYVIGDCGGTSHSLSVAASEGVYCARVIESLTASV